MLVVLRLGHAEPVTKRIFEYGFYPVELLGRLRQELHALGFEFLVGLPAVCCIEYLMGQRYQLAATVANVSSSRQWLRS